MSGGQAVVSMMRILRGPPKLTEWEIAHRAVASIAHLVLALAGLGAALALVVLVWLLVLR